MLITENRGTFGVKKDYKQQADLTANIFQIYV